MVTYQPSYTLTKQHCFAGRHHRGAGRAAERLAGAGAGFAPAPYQSHSHGNRLTGNRGQYPVGRANNGIDSVFITMTFLYRNGIKIRDNDNMLENLTVEAVSGEKLLSS